MEEVIARAKPTSLPLVNTARRVRCAGGQNGGSNHFNIKVLYVIINIKSYFLLHSFILYHYMPQQYLHFLYQPPHKKFNILHL